MLIQKIDNLIKKQMGFTVLLVLILIPLISLPGFAGETFTVSPLKPVCDRSHDYIARGMSATVGTLRDTDHLYFPEGSDRYHYRKDLSLKAADIADILDSGLYEIIPNDLGNQFTKVQPRLQMGAYNVSGRLKIGLCWWYTRFHRAAAYLAEFRPEFPPPTSDQAKRLLTKITHFQPVSIPGYSSLTAFTADYRKEIEFVLSNWQIETSLFAPENVAGSSVGKFLTSKSSRDEMIKRSMMNLVDDLEAARRPIFLMVETKGGIHAFLAVGVGLNEKNEVVITYVDSNVTQSSRDLKLNSDYSINSSTIGYEIKLAHTQFDDDFGKIQKGLQKVCGSDYKIPLK